jgi:hypothetical protein
VTGGAFSPSTAATASIKPKRKNGLKLLIAVIAAIVVLGGGASAYYFGYYMSSDTVWQQSLSNTGKGYGKLVDYANPQSQTTYKGAKIDGTLSFTTDGASYSGSLSGQYDGTNSTASFKQGFGVAKIDLETRTIKKSGNTEPDLYFQLSGFKPLVANLPIDGLDPTQLASLDGQWIEIDHTLISSIKSKVTPAATTSKPALKRADLIDAAKRFGDVNSQYIFTTKKDKAALTIVKNYGTETVDGHKTYHYKVGFVKNNVKAYVTALRDSFKQSALGTWATKQTGKTVDQIMNYDALEADADKINSSDTFDLWANTSTRLIYKVRVSDQKNPAATYTELGLNYTKGSSYPFFINFKDGTDKDGGSGTITTTLDTMTNTINAALTVTAPSVKVSSQLTAQPTNESVSVTAPAGAISLQDALNKAGLGPLYTEFLDSLNATSSSGASATGLNSLLPTITTE